MSGVVSRALLGAALLVPSLAVAQGSGRPLAIEDYYRIKSIGGVSLSPDTKWVGFSVSTRVEETNGNTSEVWVVPTDGSAPARRVSAERANVGAFTWGPDGQIRIEERGGGRGAGGRAPAASGVLRDMLRTPRRHEVHERPEGAHGPTPRPSKKPLGSEVASACLDRIRLRLV